MMMTIGLLLVLLSWESFILVVIPCCNVVVAVQTETINRLRHHSDVIMPKKRIINGNVVKSQFRYPYFSLMYGQSLCGAVLIGPRLVLSAAHCEDASSQFRIGAFENIDDGERVNIRSTIVHPDYEISQFDNDIIIFQLETDVDLPYIQLGPEYINDGTFTVIGFGDTDEGPDLALSNVLLEVELEYIDSDECDDGHGDRNEVKDDMLCAAGEDKDSCIGDSGGPLIKKGINGYNDTLVGVVSWGRGCAEKGVPGVYSRISYFYDWIVETVCDNYPEDAPSYMRCGLGSPVFTSTDKPTYAPSKQVRMTDSSKKQPTTPALTSREPTKSPSDAPLSTITSLSSTRPIVPILPVSTTFPDTINNNTESIIDLRKDLEFIAWSPTVKLLECQGDCDTDGDCERGFVCFKRNGEIETKEVTGCKRPELIADNIDVCINPNTRI